MEEENNEIKRLIAIPIVLLIGAGIAFAGSVNGSRVVGIPVFTIIIAVAFIIQWIAFIPSYLRRTEKFYDLTGSITYITVTIIAILSQTSLDLRSILLAGMVGIWAFRLGTFLFRRIQKAGEDSRFDEIKQSAVRFFSAWTIQGLWVAITASAALAAITSERNVELGIIGILGFIIWLFGFGIEVIADRQKSKFKADPENKGKFINSGLWAWSRHPNYFGEIILWIGVAILAFPVLQSWQYVTLISPVFVTLLLTKVSGIPLLEEKADERWGGQQDYEEYKKNTPVLIPRPPQS